MRIIFFAGKGGVGKTSGACATGIAAAEMGHRTLVMSLDIAHNVADIFDLKKDLLDQGKGRPVKVAKHLWTGIRYSGGDRDPQGDSIAY
jgi:arsenite-transporting ATPase